MSFFDVICNKEERSKLCEGIRQSLVAIPLSDDVRLRLSSMLQEGTAVQQIYLVVFAIVRLSGLYELIAAKSNEHTLRKIERLYHILNEHLMGECNEGTDAYLFARKIVIMADYSR